MARLDHPILLALSIVDEARSVARDKGRMPRTRALRLALAYLFTCSNGARAPFDAFWQTYAREYPRLPRPIDAAEQRNAELEQNWHAMLRALGLRTTPDLTTELAKIAAWQARENKAILAAAIRENRRAREFAKDARECHSPNGQNQPKLIAGKH